MSIARKVMMAAAGAGGGGVEVIFHGASATADTSQTVSIDMGTPQSGDIQIVGVIGQGSSSNRLDLTEPFSTALFREQRDLYDEFVFYRINAIKSGPTNFSADGTYRNTIFAWTVRGSSLPLFDTAYSYTTTVSDSISVSAGGAVIAMSSCQDVSLDVYPDIVEVSDATFLDIENGFSTSGGHSKSLAAQTIPLITTNSTVARSMIGAISFQRA